MRAVWEGKGLKSLSHRSFEREKNRLFHWLKNIGWIGYFGKEMRYLLFFFFLFFGWGRGLMTYGQLALVWSGDRGVAPAILFPANDWKTDLFCDWGFWTRFLSPTKWKCTKMRQSTFLCCLTFIIIKSTTCNFSKRPSVNQLLVLTISLKQVNGNEPDWNSYGGRWSSKPRSCVKGVHCSNIYIEIDIRAWK